MKSEQCQPGLFAGIAVVRISVFIQRKTAEGRYIYLDDLYYTQPSCIDASWRVQHDFWQETGEQHFTALISAYF